MAAPAPAPLPELLVPRPKRRILVVTKCLGSRRHYRRMFQDEPNPFDRVKTSVGAREEIALSLRKPERRVDMILFCYGRNAEVNNDGAFLTGWIKSHEVPAVRLIRVIFTPEFMFRMGTPRMIGLNAVLAGVDVDSIFASLPNITNIGEIHKQFDRQDFEAQQLAQQLAGGGDAPAQQLAQQLAGGGDAPPGEGEGEGGEGDAPPGEAEGEGREGDAP